MDCFAFARFLHCKNCVNAFFHGGNDHWRDDDNGGNDDEEGENIQKQMTDAECSQAVQPDDVEYDMSLSNMDIARYSPATGFLLNNDMFLEKLQPS